MMMLDNLVCFALSAMGGLRVLFTIPVSFMALMVKALDSLYL